MKYLGAYTLLGEPVYPPYVNISQDEETKEIVVSVREPAKDGVCGHTSAMRCPQIVFELLLEQVEKNLVKNPS